VILVDARADSGVFIRVDVCITDTDDEVVVMSGENCTGS
jgi:hypothetical protein